MLLSLPLLVRPADTGGGIGEPRLILVCIDLAGSEKVGKWRPEGGEIMYKVITVYFCIPLVTQ